MRTANCFCCILFSTGLATTTFAEMPTSNLKDPKAVRQIRDRSAVANAGWWGFDPADSTSAIQGAIDSGAATVVIPFVGQDWIVGPIILASNQQLILEPGVIIAAKTGSFQGPEDSLFTGRLVENVTIRGYGATLRMRKDDYRSRAYKPSEWRHTLNFRGARNVKVLGLTLENSGGDGIYIGPTWNKQRVPCKEFIVLDCRMHNHYRQGITVVSGDSIRIEDCLITNTRGTAPQAAIDLEPSHPRDLLSQIQILNCVAKDNAGTGFMLNLTRLNGSSAEVSVLIADSLVQRSRQPGIRALIHDDNAPDGLIEFRNCVVEDTEYAGAMCVWNSSVPLQLRFIGCKWNNTARRGAEAPVHLELTDDQVDASAPGIRFKHCYIYDTAKRAPLRIIGKRNRSARFNVSGDVTVINNRMAQPGSDVASSQLQDLTVDFRTRH